MYVLANIAQIQGKTPSLEDLQAWLPEGSWLWNMIPIALTLRWLGFDKMLLSLYKEIFLPWLKNVIDRTDERERGQISSLQSDGAVWEIIRGRYSSVARYLINNSWAVLSDFRSGSLTEEKIMDRIRVDTREFLRTAKDALGRYTAYSTKKKLSSHLGSMDEHAVLSFYAPIVAAIVELKPLGHRLGYEELRLAVLMETDNMIADAVEYILTEKDN